MHRFLFATLVLIGSLVHAAVSTPAKAQAVGGVSATPPLAIRQAVRGIKTRYADDFTSHGSGSSSNANFDWRPVLQAAHDAVAADIDAEGNTGQTWAGTVIVRGKVAPYLVSGPVYVWHANITFQGEGNATYILSGSLNGAMGCPIFMLGTRTPQACGGQFLANFSTYRPDCFGKVDTTLATATGQRWGFRAQGQSFILAQGTPFSHGGPSPKYGGVYVDNWVETQKVTIEFACEGFGANGRIPDGQNLFGTADGQGNASPFWVFTDVSPDGGTTPGPFTFYYETVPFRGGPTTTARFGFPQVIGGGVQRVTIQCNLVTGQIVTWVNGLQTSLTSATANSFFLENKLLPFCVAQVGLTGVYEAAKSDVAFYGLEMSKTLRYNVSTNGSGQVRTADSASYSTVKDNYRYADNGTDSANLIAYFKFTENPASLDMMMGIQCGASTNFSAPAFLCHASQNSGGISGQSVRNMHLGTSRPYSTPLLIGQVLVNEFTDLMLEGGLWGASNGVNGSNYPLHFRNCTFSGTDAAFFGIFAIVSFTDCNITNGGRFNLFFFQSNVYTAGAMFIGGVNVNCQTSVATYIGGSDGGGIMCMRNIVQDNEGNPILTAPFSIQRNAGGGSMVFEDIQCGSAGGCPTFLLDDVATGSSYLGNYIKISRISSSGSDQPCFVQVNGNGWQGTIDDLVFGQTPVLTCLGTYGVGSSLAINSLDYPAPPHAGTWTAGTTTLKVRQPADGLYRQYDFSRTGTYGSTTPPSCVGTKAYQSSPQALAAAAVDHTVIATTAFGGSSYGWFSDTMTKDALGLLFGQTAGFGAPTSLQFRLVTSAALKSGAGVVEASGGNYAPVTLTNNTTNFSASSAGTKANGTAITWPTLTVAINGVVGVYVNDQGGRFLAYVQLATPQNFAINATPTIGIGALTFTQTPTNNPGFLTQYGWGRIADRYFGGTAITPPATWYVGLNTAHAAAGSAPTEPSGNGYARVGLTNDTAHWGTRFLTSYVSTTNLQLPTFATPTGSGWGTIIGAPIYDAATSGNCWWTADAPNAVACPAGSPPIVGIGSLLLSL